MENYSCEFSLHRMQFLRKKLSIEDGHGTGVYFVRPKTMAASKTFVVSDAEGNDLAKIRQCVSLILPKYRIDIDGAEPFFVKRKFSLSHDYSISGVPWIVEGDFTGFRYRVTDQAGRRLFEIHKEMNTWDDRYTLKVFDTGDALHGISIAIAIDAAISAVRKSSHS